MYDRANPSPRYLELISQYKVLHTEGEKIHGLAPENTFPGVSLLPHIDRIKRLIQETDSFSLLDYGCGKGMQYQAPVVDVGLPEKEMLADYWGVTAIQLYDPCFMPFSTLPSGRFDGVISTDMLEHCSEDDVPWIIGEMFSFSNKFLFSNVACYPAIKSLPNGENAHCTIRDPEWWASLFREIGKQYPGVIWELVAVGMEKNPSSGESFAKEMVFRS